MRSLKEVVKKFKFEAFDGRDAKRMLDYLPSDGWSKLGFEIKEGAKHIPVEYTEENIIKALKGDLEFAFEKAYGQRGISASVMFNVIKMWNFCLGNELGDYDDNNYCDYGLPYLRMVNKEFGWDLDEA